MFVNIAEEIAELFTASGYEVVENHYIQRKTINRKETIAVERIFVQGKFKKVQIGSI